MPNVDFKKRILAAIAAGGVVSGVVVGCGSEDDSKSSGDGGAGVSSKQDGASGESGNDASVGDATDAAADAEPNVVPTPRRPFLVGAHLRSAEAAFRDDWSLSFDDVTDIDPATRSSLARAWLDDGLQEHASVAAFARFAMLLLAVGAPPRLVAGAQRASLDEIAHAEACFGLARRYGAEAAGPGRLDVSAALGRATLADVVALTAEEGCIGETLGAVIARAQHEGATDPAVRRVLARIADGEARHADLAWRFVAWALAKDPTVAAAFSRGIARGIAATRAMPARPLPVDAAMWRAHGRLHCVEARAIAEGAIDDVIAPALSTLGLWEPAPPMTAAVAL